MSTLDEFAAECNAAAKALRRVPAEARRKIAAESKTRIAEPLAAEVGRAARGPWARILTPGSKARAAADPTIIVGGKTPTVRNGAGPSDVVFGTELGGKGEKQTHIGRARYTREDVAAAPRGSRIRAGQIRRGRVSAAERAAAARTIHQRRTTVQFVNNRYPFILDTVEASMPEVLDEFGDLILETLDEQIGGEHG